MFYRRRLLLALLESLNGEAHRKDFQKHVFLLTQGQSQPAYDFIPYRLGCYSFTLESDRKALMRHGWLRNQPNWVLNDNHLSNAHTLPSHSMLLTCDDQTTLALHTQQWGACRGRQLIREVYIRYPSYATRSEIAHEILSKAELLKVQECKPAPLPGPALFTIGYQGKSIEAYLQQLINAQVDTLCDVRHNPTSRKVGFSGRQLRHVLNCLGIEYQHYPKLGIASVSRRHLQTSDNYQQLFDNYHQTTLQSNTSDQDAIVQLLVQRNRVALTCFELEPHQCHRSCLAKAIKAKYKCLHTPLLIFDNL